MFLISVGGGRKTMKPYTFSDGVTIPKGNLIEAPTAPIHRDESIYENANVFDGFRFRNLRERQGENFKHYTWSTGIDFLHFGHGHHAWY
jgi:cytochrome P450